MEEQGESDINKTPTKILVSDLPSIVHDEFLVMFFENTRKHGGGPVVSVDYDEESASAIVEFEEPEGVENVLKKQPLKMMGQEISVEVFDPGPVTLCTVEVTGPHDLICEEQVETLHMYFEHRKSRGDEVKDIVFDGDIALVTFFSEEVARRVAEKGDHKINKKAISVKLHSPESKKLRVDREGVKRGGDETNSKPEDVENEPALTVKVKGVKGFSSRDIVEFYFDNKRRSGGFDLQEIISDEEDDDVLYVKYQSEEVARAVAGQSHVLGGVRLTVSLHTPSRPPPSYPNKILITGLKPTTTEDGLSNFIEAKSGYIPVPGSMTFHAEQEGVVMVTLDRELDFEILEKMCEKRLDGAKLNISKVPISNCIIVSDIAPDVTKDTIELYFENMRKSNGGPVSKVVMNDDNTCFVYFENYRDAKRVSDKGDHMINRKRISVKLLTPESKMKNPSMYREGSERSAEKRNNKPEEADKGELSVKMPEKFYDVKKLGKHWLLCKAGKRFKQISALTDAQKVELLDNCLIVDDHLIYEIQECEDDIVIVKIDNIQVREVNHKSFADKNRNDSLHSNVCSALMEEEVLKNEEKSATNRSYMDDNSCNSLEGGQTEETNVIQTIQLGTEAGSSEGADKQKRSTDQFAKYVEVKNVPTHYEKETLRSEIFKEGVFPVKIPKLIYCKGSEEALLICQTESDAAELSQCKDIQPFVFTQVNRKVVGSMSSKINETSIKYIKGVKTYEKFKEKLRFAEIEIKTEDPFEIMAPTPYQYKYAMMTVEDFSHMADSSDSDVKFRPDAKLTRGLSNSYNTQIVEKVNDVDESLWDIIRCSDAYRQLEAKCKSITYEERSILIELLGEDVALDEISKIKGIVTSFEGKELKEVTVPKSSKASVNQWCSEINDTIGYNCCQYVCDSNRVIIFCNSYDDILRAKHILRVNAGEIKQTGGGRRGRKTVNEKENKSLDTPPENVPMFQQRTKEKCTFDWATDAEHVERYGTQENIRVLVYKANIVNLPVDCIVNSANDTLSHGGGISAVTAKAAGSSLTKEGHKRIKEEGRLPVGTAYTTTAGKLRYDCVIHAVSPRWSDYFPHTLQKVKECETHLYQAVYNSFLEAERRQLKSIALPAISSAIFGVPDEMCVYQYAKAIVDYSRKESSRQSSLKEIHFMDINYSMVQKIQECFQQVFWEGNMPEYNRNKFVREGNTWRSFSDHSESDRRYPQTKKHHQLKTDALPPETNAIQCEALSSFDEHKHVYTYLLSDREKQELLLHRGDIFSVKADTVVILIDQQGRRGQIADELYGRIPIKKCSKYTFKVQSDVQNKKLSDVFLTYGYECGYQNILHVVFPAFIKGKSTRQSVVRKTYNNIFSFCRERSDISSCVMTLISTDVTSRDDLRMSAEEFLQSYLENICKSESKKCLCIHLVCKDDKDFHVVRTVFDDYVQKTTAIKKDQVFDDIL